MQTNRHGIRVTDKSKRSRLQETALTHPSSLHNIYYATLLLLGGVGFDSVIILYICYALRGLRRYAHPQ